MAAEDNQRKEPRARALKTGRLLLESGGVIDCVIRDASDKGVRIRIGAATPLPKRFRLLSVSDASVAPVELKWQRGLEAGIELLEPPKPTQVVR